MQWMKSVESLRKYNRDIPLHLFYFGDVPDRVQITADQFDVVVHQLVDYKEYLDDLMPAISSVLVQNPRLHKYLVLTHFKDSKISQILYLDCDTFFFDDVDNLFDRYRDFGWYAREEPFSKRNNFGYDEIKIDEDLLCKLATMEGLSYVEPYNTGVFLLNQGLWRELGGHLKKFLNYTYRIMSGYNHNKNNNEFQRYHGNPVYVSQGDLTSRLDLPPNNEWITGQIAWWLTLGNVKGLTHGVFSPTDVVQNREYYSILPTDRPVLIHYFTNWEEIFFTLLQSGGTRYNKSYAFQKNFKYLK